MKSKKSRKMHLLRLRRPKGREEFGFARTTCDCPMCILPCKVMPGYMIPADLGRMRNSMRPDMTFVEFGRAFLEASPGTVVGTTLPDGTVEETRIPTLRPKMFNGACVFLEDAERCTIHKISPFGCAFFDYHMDLTVGEQRSLAGLRAIANSFRALKSHYTDVLVDLIRRGQVGISPEEGRAKLRELMGEGSDEA